MQRDHTDTQFKRLSENLETAEAGCCVVLVDLKSSIIRSESKQREIIDDNI